MGSSEGTIESAYTVPEKALGTLHPVKVICIGAGASGINLAYQVQQRMEAVELVIYEKNASIGGTWLENTYPGVACDIPAHNYQFSWALNPHWSEFYASGSEILQYFQHTAASFGMEKYIKFQTRVVRASWDEEEGLWQVKVRNDVTGEETDDSANFLINGSGFLNNWKWPDIPNLHSFKGDLLHSANWDQSASFKDKSVVVVGNGSSGIQILTAIYPEVKDLITFVRNPTWISTSFAQQFAGPDGANFQYTEEQKNEFRTNPQKHETYRKAIEEDMCGRFDLALKDSEFQKQARAYLGSQMKAKLGHNHPLVDKIVPEFGVGCRRPTPGLGYLETLAKGNVRVVEGAISQVLPDGVKLPSGEVIKVDSIVCATGFDVSWKPRFPVIGRGGVDLAETWKDRPTGYLGLAVADLPNYFVYMGPNSPLSHGSALPSIEYITKYICRMIRKAQIEDYKSFVPSKKAVKDFVEHADAFLTRTVWSTNCTSWFKGGKSDGPVIALHPGSRIHWFHMMEEPRLEDWEWTTWSPNRFAYLGNGLSTCSDPGKDTTWFLGNCEPGFFQL